MGACIEMRLKWEKPTDVQCLGECLEISTSFFRNEMKIIINNGTGGRFSISSGKRGNESEFEYEWCSKYTISLHKLKHLNYTRNICSFALLHDDM